MTEDTSIDRLLMENIHQTTADGVTVKGIDINAEIKERIERDVIVSKRTDVKAKL